MDFSCPCGCTFSVTYTSWNRDVFIREEDRFHASVSIVKICEQHNSELKTQLEKELVDEHRKIVDTLYNKWIGGGGGIY